MRGDGSENPADSAPRIGYDNARAVVVELVDTLGLGPSGRKAMGVQVPPTAPYPESS